MQQTVKAPELYGDYWFNSAPLSLGSIQGQNILLFFWNYSSPASLRLLPLIKEWNAIYAELGLFCIGVHSPEFSFAAEPKNIDEFLKKNSVEFPIVTDNERLIAGAYRVSRFPTLVLISSNGNIYDVVTETFSLSRLERSIQYLLRQSGFFGQLPMLQSIESERSWEDSAVELSTGYIHGSLGNSEGYSPELAAEYRDPGIYVEGKFYAHGIWRADRNTFHYEGDPNEGYLICISAGENIDVLVGSHEKNTLRLRTDDAQLHVEQMGRDVKLDAKGNSVIAVAEPQFLSMFHATSKEHHAVKFIPLNAGMTFYKFSLFTSHHAQDIEHPIHNN
jgi:thiol-disulfide isomerase/thioredoxin